MTRVPYLALVFLAFLLSPRVGFRTGSALDSAVDRYFEVYEGEIERAIAQAEHAPSYTEFKSYLDNRLNVLMANWERDLDRLRTAARERDGEGSTRVDERASLRESQSEERVRRAKAEYLARHTGMPADEERKLKEEAGLRFSERYQALLLDLGEEESASAESLLAQYRTDLVLRYREDVRLYAESLEKRYEARREELATLSMGEGLPEETVLGSLEARKRAAVHERKVFLSALFASYVNKGYEGAYADRRSLRRAMEAARAKAVAEEIEAEVRRELARSVEDRLDEILSREAVDEESFRDIGGSTKKLFDKGLDLWAKAAGDLVEMEHEWYRSYGDVFNDGVEAWSRALDTVRRKKQEWSETFSQRIENALQTWEAGFTRLEGARAELLESLREYTEEKNRVFDSYIEVMDGTLEYGSGAIAEIDRYIAEFGAMARESLLPVVPEELARAGGGLTNEQIGSLMRFFLMPYVPRGFASNEVDFWSSGVPDKALYGLMSYSSSTEHGGTVSATEYIGGDRSRYLQDSEAFQNGFRLRVWEQATVHRVRELRSHYGGYGGGDLLWYDYVPKRENRYYTIEFTLDSQGSWARRAYENAWAGGGAASLSTKLLDPVAIGTQVNAYLREIDELESHKREVVKSLTSLQASVVGALSDSGSVLDNQVLTSEEDFRRRYFESGEITLPGGLDRDLHRAFYEAEFWRNERSVIEEVLSYAFERAGREEARTTIEAYEKAKEEYESAVLGYGLLIGGPDGTDVGTLRGAERRIGKLSSELDEARKELSGRETELKKALTALSRLKFGASGLEALRYSILAEVRRALSEKHEFLNGVLSFEQEEEDEALGNLTSEILEDAISLYKRVEAEYGGGGGSTSLSGVLGLRKRLEGIAAELYASVHGQGHSGEAGAGYHAPGEETLAGLKALSRELAGSGAFEEVLGEVDRLVEVLEAAENLSEDPDARAAVVGQLSVIDRMLFQLSEAKRGAYGLLWESGSDPGAGYPAPGTLDSARQRCVAASVDGLRRYVAGRLEELAGMRELSEELAKELLIGTARGGGTNGAAQLTQGEPDFLRASLSKTLERFVREKKTAALEGGLFDATKDGWLDTLGETARKLESLDRFALYVSDAMGVPGIWENGDGEKAYDEAVSRLFGAVRANLARERERMLGLREDLEPGVTGFPTVEEYLASLRAKEDESFFGLRDLWQKEVPALSSLERVRSFSSSRVAGEELRLLSLLIGGGEKSLSFRTLYESELAEAMETIGKLADFSLDGEGDERFDLFESLSGDGLPMLTEAPLSGNLDKPILRFFAEMDRFERNGLLNGKAQGIFASLAGYLASCIALEDRVTEGIPRYFSRLRGKAKSLGFTPEEEGRIARAMEGLLLCPAEKGAPEMSTSELRAALEQVQGAIQAITSFAPGSEQDAGGYFKALLDRGGYEALAGLASDIPLGLKQAEVYREEVEYSGALRRFLQAPSGNQLGAVFETGRMARLYENDPETALDLIESLSHMFLLRSRLAGSVSDRNYADLYPYIEGRFREKVLARGLSALEADSERHGAFVQKALVRITSRLKLAESRVFGSGAGGEGTGFSDAVETWSGALAALVGAAEEYRNRQGPWDIEGSIRAVEGARREEFAPGLTEDEFMYLKGAVRNEELLRFARLNFVKGDGEPFTGAYMKRFDATFRDYLLEKGILPTDLPFPDAYDSFLLADPLGASFAELRNALTQCRDSLADAVRRSGFRGTIEADLAALAEGALKDERGVLFDARTSLTSLDPGITGEAGGRETPIVVASDEATEFMVAFNLRVPEKSGRSESLEHVYFEGPGERAFEYGKDRAKGTIETAVTYVTGDPLVNLYIDRQNRFLNSLVSLARLSGISDARALNYLNVKTLRDADLLVDLDLFSPSNSKVRTLDERAEEILRTAAADLGAALLDTVTGDREGEAIAVRRFADGNLLDMLSSARVVWEPGANLARAIKDADLEANRIREQIAKLRGSESKKGLIEEKEDELRKAVDAYDSLVVRVNEARDAADGAYGDYLKTKEVYFYANEIYRAEESGAGTLGVYARELSSASGRLEAAEETYGILKDIKMSARPADAGDELSALAKDLKERGGSLNRAEEALQLFEIFHSLLRQRLSSLEGEIRITTGEIEAIGKDSSLELRRRELESLRGRADAERAALEALSLQYGMIDFSAGSPAHDLLSRGLQSTGALDQRQAGDRIRALSAYIVSESAEIFTGRSGSVAKMLVDFEGHAAEARENYRRKLNYARLVYEERAARFRDGMLLPYADYSGERAACEAELDVTGKQVQSLFEKMGPAERNACEETLRFYRGRWDEIEPAKMDESAFAILLLEKRREELGELALLYGYLTGKVDGARLTSAERHKWGDNLEGLKRKFGIAEKDVLRYAALVREGVLLDTYDFSTPGILKAELERKRAFLERVGALDGFAMVTGSTVFQELLAGMKEAYTMSLGERAGIERDRFELQSQSLVQERVRFLDKVGLERKRGLFEWAGQERAMLESERRWLDEMREMERTGEERWKAKEEEYVRRRDQWLTEAEQELARAGDGELRKAEEEIAKLLGGGGADSNKHRLDRERLEKEYVREVGVPQWLGRYDVIARATFGRLQRGRIGEKGLAEAVRIVREKVKGYEDDRQAYEVKRLYFSLKRAREEVLAEIRGVDAAHEEMVSGVVKEAGFKESGDGFEKRVLADYSLLGGKKKKTMRIGRYVPYEIDLDRFSLPGEGEVERIGDGEERKVFVIREAERLRRAKEEVLGNESKIGAVFLKHIGRFPTGDEVGRYVEEKRSKGLFSGIQKLFGKLVQGVASLFKNERGGKGKDEEWSAFQARLMGSITHSSNKGLEVGRIMLEYQRLEVMEAEAEAKADAGFFNAPLFPGGPSLKSIGSVALSVVTGGSTALVQSAAQLGWGTFATAATHAEGKLSDEAAALSLIQGITTTALSGGFGQGKGIGGAWSERKLAKLSEMGSLSDSLGGVATKAWVDARAHFTNQALTGSVNAVKVDGKGRLAFDTQQFGMGLASTVGVYGGSLVSNEIALLRGARYVNGGYNYGLMPGMNAYENKRIRALGELAGGVTRQVIDNAVGAADGFTFNVLNARDLGLRNDVGMVAVTVGGRNGARWDASTSGVNLSYSGIRDIVKGQREVARYNTVMGGDDRDAQVAYIEKNLLGYAAEGLKGKEYRYNRREIEGLMAELDEYAANEGVTEDIRFVPADEMRENSENRVLGYREGETVYVNSSLTEAFHGIKDRQAVWSLNKAAFLAGVLAHEWTHDGKKGSTGEETAEDIAAYKFETVVWKGLKEKLGVYESEMDGKLLVYENFSESEFEDYIKSSYVVGEDARNKAWDIGDTWSDNRIARAYRNKESVSSELVASLTLKKGFKDKTEEWAQLYNETGIVHGALQKLAAMLDSGKGYDIIRDLDGYVKATDVTKVDFGNVKKIDGYFLLTQLNRNYSPTEGMMITQRLSVENGSRADYYELAYNGATGESLEAIMDRDAEKFKGFVRDLNNPVKIQDFISPQYVEIQKALMEGVEWGEEKKWLGSGYEKSSIVECNRGFANLLNLFGHDRYFGETYKGVAHATKRPDGSLGDILAEGIIDDMKKWDAFLPVENVIDFGEVKSASALQKRMEELPNYAILLMKNIEGNASHVSVVVGGESYDVNFRRTGQYGPVALWVTVGGENKLKTVLETAIKYKKFNFKDEWIEDKIKNEYYYETYEEAHKYSKKAYSEILGPYELSIYIPKYTLTYSLRFEDLLKYAKNN